MFLGLFIFDVQKVAEELRMELNDIAYNVTKYSNKILLGWCTKLLLCSPQALIPKIVECVYQIC